MMHGQKNIKFVLVYSVYASCFGGTDHPQAFKNNLLSNPKTKSVYIDADYNGLYNL